MLELGLIGNCSVSALINDRGALVWSCLPRYDGDPVFCSLLRGADDYRGAFTIEMQNFARAEQQYLRNTAILLTTLHDDKGGILEITDFAPRFQQFGRMYHPMMFVRRVRRLAGSPVIRIHLEPTCDYGASAPTKTFGSNHIRYVMPDLVLRLTTDASITSVLERSTIVLDRDLTFILGPDETLVDSVADMGSRFFGETRHYWHDWVRSLGIPFEWQQAVIRAAITLKLSAYDDTGSIVAAMTTSIPEAPDTIRNWDYRYCWLRDSYFVVNALNRLSATGTMERYLRYIVNIVAGAQDRALQPVYGISGRIRLDERIAPALTGYRGMGPVRIGNAAYHQVQNDVYGSTILSATHVFFDERLDRPGDEQLFHRLETLGEIAARVYNEPDAGIWELRGTKRVHTFSAVMCWVACDRLALIATRIGLGDRAAYWRTRAEAIHKEISERAWHVERGCFAASFGGDELDASLLLLNELGFLQADDPRFAATVEAVERELRRGDFIYRYVIPDDFGEPENAFTVCTFWYIDALIALGRRDEARALFGSLLACRNRLGLLSEDIDTRDRTLWGNFPQTYSMVGLINSAVRLSKSWEEIL